MKIIGKFLINLAIVSFAIGVLFGCIAGLLEIAIFMGDYFQTPFAGLLVLVSPLIIGLAISATASDLKEEKVE